MILLYYMGRDQWNEIFGGMENENEAYVVWVG